MIANPPRQEPRIPAIFCSCGERPELVESLPIQLARFMIELTTCTTSAKMLKSRNWLTSYGLMKLSPGTRDHSNGVMSAFHDSFRITKPAIITKIG